MGRAADVPIRALPARLPMSAFVLSHPMPLQAGPSPDTLARCLVLALLLHLAVVVWVGNVDGGSAAPGRGAWGRSDSIELRLGQAGGSESTAATAAPAAPEPARGPVGTADQPRFGGAVREEEAPPPPEPRTAPGAAQLGDWAPVAPPAAVDRNLLPAATAPLSQPALVAAPAVPDLARVQAAPPPERALAAEPLPRAPGAAAPPIERSAPLAAPAPLPELSTPALARPLPVPDAATAVPPAAVVTPTPAPTPTPAAAPATAIEAATASPPTPSTPAPPAVSGVPSLKGATAGPGRGAPDAGSRIGPDAATPPAASASAPPLNLALPRSRGGPLSAGSTPGVLSLLPRPPEKNKLATEIDKSAKTDCRTAYSGLGPLAVIPLAADALKKEGGCKW